MLEKDIGNKRERINMNDITKKWFRDLRFKFKIFFWYLITEPFRQIKEFYNAIMHMLEALNKTLTWTYVALVFMIISLILGNKNIAALFLFFLLFVILLWEWERGFFMYRYRQKIKKKIYKEAKKNGTRRKEFDERCRRSKQYDKENSGSEDCDISNKNSNESFDENE